jgi:hypothetical protein
MVLGALVGISELFRLGRPMLSLKQKKSVS